MGKDRDKMAEITNSDCTFSPMASVKVLGSGDAPASRLGEAG